jgi:NADH dehydrogenase
MERIGILGAGFGGLRAALDLEAGLRKRGLLKDYEVVLMDRSAYHTYTPLLYKLAAKTGRATDIFAATISLKKILRGRRITFLEDDAENIDAAGGVVMLRKNGPQAFKYLILAPGLESNFFGIPGLEENSVPLKTANDVRRIRQILATLPEDAAVIIGGAGPNGVELAAEIKKNAPERTVTIIEAMPAILPGFPENVQVLAARRLKRLRVEIKLNEPITEVKSAEALAKSGNSYHFGLFIWTGGLKSPELIAHLPLRREARGRFETDECMECLPASPDLSLNSKVYALGDIVSFIDPRTRKPAPGMARPAIFQGGIAARNILSEIDGKPMHVKYKVRKLPYVIPLGGKWAIAEIGPAVVTGFPAWLFKEAIEVKYFSEIMPFFQALKTALKGMRI